MTTQSNFHEVTIELNGVDLVGNLSLPDDAEGIVLFAHGSGSSRLSPRNQYVAGVLNNAGIATLLFDLLTTAEEEIDQRTRELRFNISLLADRLAGVVDWVSQNPETADMPIGLFGASTGAAAALIVAADKPEKVDAVVSRGGRPDLAEDFLPQVKSPSLFIIGGRDEQVISMNRAAASLMDVSPEIRIVTGATHLFEEPGALKEVAGLARNWFLKHLVHNVSGKLIY